MEFHPNIVTHKIGYITILLSLVLLRSDFGYSQSVTDTMFRGRENMKLFDKAALDEVNRHRKSLGLKELIVDSTLCRKARAHTEWMVNNKKFEHSYSICCGECILSCGYMPNDTYEYNGKLIIRVWIESPPHNAIMTDPQYTKVGIGVVIVKKTYNELYSTLVVE